MKCMQQVVMCILAHGLQTELFLIYDARTKFHDETTGKNTSDNTVDFGICLLIDNDFIQVQSGCFFLHLCMYPLQTVILSYKDIVQFWDHCCRML